MNEIEMSPEQVVPMDDIASRVFGLRIGFVNVFGIINPDVSWTLLDAGLSIGERRIRTWAEKQFGMPPNSIVLTHGHFDHVGAAQALAEYWNVPIFAHELEFPYLTGEREYPAPNVGAGGGLMTLLSPLLPRGPINIGSRLRRLPDEESSSGALAELPEWEILHTPGHTPGHVSFFRREDKTLLVGDAFCTTKPESFFEAALVQHPELHGPPAYFTWNWDLARQSVQRLAELEPSVVVPGHGKPLAGQAVADGLRALAGSFDAIAVPDNR